MHTRIIPPKLAAQLLPSELAPLFNQWADYLYRSVDFNMPDSEIHAYGHTERVLFHALNVGQSMLAGDDEALEILAHAALFHDTQREDEYLDTGHGARGAVNYEKFCRQHPEMTFHREAVYLMRYHDLDDRIGKEAIDRDFPDDAERVKLLYAIFKDSDALDRWRLGCMGLDPKYLRTEPSRKSIDFARQLVAHTMDPDLLSVLDKLVRKSMGQNE